jgi:hypothetical protein
MKSKKEERKMRKEEWGKEKKEKANRNSRRGKGQYTTKMKEN